MRIAEETSEVFIASYHVGCTVELQTLSPERETYVIFAVGFSSSFPSSRLRHHLLLADAAYYSFSGVDIVAVVVIFFGWIIKFFPDLTTT